MTAPLYARGVRCVQNQQRVIAIALLVAHVLYGLFWQGVDFTSCLFQLLGETNRRRCDGGEIPPCSRFHQNHQIAQSTYTHCPLQVSPCSLFTTSSPNRVKCRSTKNHPWLPCDILIERSRTSGALLSTLQKCS